MLVCVRVRVRACACACVCVRVHVVCARTRVWMGVGEDNEQNGYAKYKATEKIRTSVLRKMPVLGGGLGTGFLVGGFWLLAGFLPLSDSLSSSESDQLILSSVVALASSASSSW